MSADYKKMYAILCGAASDALDALPDGNFVRVDEGALRLLNGRVAKVDKRKRLVNVEFDILGDTRSAWLTYRLPEDGMSADD